MVEHAALVKRWIEAGQLLPVNPGDDTPLYDPEDIRTLALAMKHASRKFKTEVTK